MIVYNVTTKIDHTIHEQWLRWLREEHIPEMIQTGCFHEARVLRILETDESDGPTYAVQYHAETERFYQQYLENFAISMRQKSLDKWGAQFIAFRSVMRVVN